VKDDAKKEDQPMGEHEGGAKKEDQPIEVEVDETSRRTREKVMLAGGMGSVLFVKCK
jgi:hypothetical protein